MYKYEPVSGAVTRVHGGVIHSVNGGYHGGHTGVLHIFSGVSGYCRGSISSKGEFVRPLLRAGAVSPDNVPEKLKKAGLLGMACGCLSSPSIMFLEPVGARNNAFGERFLPLTPDGYNVEEYTPTILFLFVCVLTTFSVTFVFG